MTDAPFAATLQQTNTAPLTQMIAVASQLTQAGQWQQARQVYQSWIEHNPENPQLYVACFNCASLDTMAKDQAAAAASLNRAIALNPDFIPAYINLGRVCEESGAADRAVELWRLAASRAAPITGSSVNYAVTALTQMARVLTGAQQSELAEEAFHHCLGINPRQPDIIEQYTALRLAQCKWPITAPTEFLDRKALLGGINPLSMAAYTDDPLLQLASGYRYVKRSAWDAPHNGESDRRHAPIDLTGRRLRIGYVSSDLRDHAIGYLMAELFELHDKKNVEIFAYYCGPASTSALTHRIKAAVEHWVDVREMSDDDAAKRIAADGIDILVDVNGHTRDSKTGVFARRCAPVQVNWLGYPGSMGSPYHHYIIADDWIIPPSSELYYSEKVLRLPCYQPNDRKRPIAAEPPTRASAGLPDNAFVFCCFNGTHKISRFTFERWMTILGQVPDSVLWLLDTSEKTRARLREMAEKKGVAGSRLVFAPKMPNAQHLARYPLADLFLDSAPYGAHTTASDALWMGVPVLTLSGRCFASRVCGSLVRSAGLGDLVCEQADEYIARAVALASDRPAIARYKARLREGRDSCVLFDTNLLTSRLEDLYRGMADAHNKGAVPQPDLVNLDAYFDAGLDHDHDTQEVFAIADYHGHYREKLKRFHLSRPLQADSRLWGERDIAAADHPHHPATAPFGDIESLRHLARMLNSQGRTLECLDTLLTLKERGGDQDSLLDDIRAAIDPTITGFNRSLADGKVDEAARYADALAALLPGNEAALNSALTCNVALGRKQKAAQFAASLIRIDPGHEAARSVLAELNVTVIPSAPTPPVLHPLLQLRDLYDQASAILCAPLTDAGVQTVQHLRAQADKLTIPASQDSDLAGWEKHYRMALKAIDPSAARGATPPAVKDDKIAFASASGRKLEAKALAAAAKSLRAKAVFFAAADKAYIDLYGRQYVDSILEHSDVSSLIVLHVIGGAKTLPAIAKSLGVSSNRLILSGDTFDAGAVKTKCYDAPPKGMSAMPIAHLQSVRFLRVGALLQSLKLPVLVSDIDIILQRGVADLLEQFADHDLVLNENAVSANAGSRYTANLLLLNPTRTTDIFLRFMRAFLEKALAGAEVSRWIDQFALIQARHHLARVAPQANIGYFDVTKDINNLMYRSWQENPFRFLSLYHGFDMSSLPKKAAKSASAPATAAKRKKKASR
jgi:predicted O-linked N-acetylglucosamine transferase (SPINDLY family)